MSRTGETLVDLPEATIRVLVDRAELVLTYARLRNEGGPATHVHRQHADGFVLLEGELDFELGGERLPHDAGTVVAIPPGVVHTYRHEGTDQVQFLNFHAPGMGFADYLFGQSPPEEADNFFDPPDDRRPASDAFVHRTGEGETVTDRAERTIRILADIPELTLTWTRYSQGEVGPDPHIHKEHCDCFYVLDGGLVLVVGADLERVVAGAGTFVLAPPEVVHTFRNEGPAEATFLNLL